MILNLFITTDEVTGKVTYTVWKEGKNMEQKPIIMAKSVKYDFVLDRNVKFTHYKFYCEELNQYFILPVGQLYIVGTSVADNSDETEYDDLIEAEECHGCGEVFAEDSVCEHDNGEYYCEDCEKELTICSVCGNERHINDFTSEDDKIRSGKIDDIVCDDCIMKRDKDGKED